MIKMFCDECGYDITGQQNFARRSEWYAKGKYLWSFTIEPGSNTSGRKHIKSDGHLCDMCFKNLQQIMTQEEPKDETND